MRKLTGKQCRAARSLLKWNIHDLSNRVKSILPKRLDSFEHGAVHLMEWENDELMRVFKKAGVRFRPDMEVELHREDVEPDKIQGGMTQEGAHIVLDTDLNVLSDSSAQKALIPNPLKPVDKPKDENSPD